MTSAFKASKEVLQKFKPSVMRLYDDAETASLIKKIVGVAKPGAFMNIAYEGVKELVDVEEKILLETFAKYGAEDLGSEYGEKWWNEKITFFYPGHMMDIPQMFGTMDTIAPYDKIEKIYWAMKNAIETKYPYAKFIAHFSHWYEWGCMMYDRFIIDGEHVPQDPVEAMRLHNEIWTLGIRTALANGGVVNDHHGVGIKLGRMMKEQYGPAMQVFEGIKKALDPNGIMNPFKLGL
jgi:alkyldihydroxyacetonephosphate synthase